jgi:crotonobetainyl-CoA:carnitine CoA-transferase CaiB-like acyl-CoA transferase
VIAPGLADDPRFRSAADRKRNEDELEKHIQVWTRERDRWDVTRALQAVGVPAFPSLSTEDLVRDPHLNERGFFARLEHPEVGVRTHAGIPWRLEHGPNGVREPAPVLGADTDAVLGGLCGYSPEDIRRLRDEGVLT